MTLHQPKSFLVKASLLFVLFFFAGIFGIQAQDGLTPDGEHIKCSTVDVEKTRLDERYQEYLERFEEYINAERAKLNGRVATVYTIPVVFHVVHDNDAVGTGDNISATFINAQLDQLNNDFRKIMGTSGNGAGVDTEIQFCAATLDENGGTLAEPGIDRVNSNTKGWTAPPYGTPIFGCLLGADLDYIDNTIKPQSIWNPEEYMNVWILDMVCGVLGYAQFPEAATLPGIGTGNGGANSDGVVVLPTTVGSTDTPFPGGDPYNKGRTLTHEVGHWLGLRHIWGDGNCSVDDFCADTPNAGGSNFGCPTVDSCPGDGPDQVENYMDYTDDDCMNIFTQDQTDRMRIVMGATGVGSPRREILASSTKCGAVADGFSITATNSPVSVVQPDDAVFTFNVAFTGSFTGPVTLSTSGLPGSISSSFSTNPVNSAGAYTLTLSGTGSVSAGTYNFSIDGTGSGSLMDSAPATLIVMEESSNDCFTLSSSNVPVAIPNQTTVTSTINVGTSGTVSDVNVSFSGVHDAVRDLIFVLVSPNGTTVQLVDLDDPCNRQDDFNLGFDDQATLTISNIPCPPTDGRSYQPEQALSAFNGQQVNGTWTLRITDDRNRFTGQLNAWQLAICVGNAPAPTCTDGIQNGDETGIDCGGSMCAPCMTATCTDGIQNGQETGVDCGGPDCMPCNMATCDAPTGLFETNNTGSSVTLNWGAVSAANSYTVQGRQQGTNPWRLTTNSNTNSVTISNNIFPGVTYEWRVRSNCTGENSPYSAIATFTAGSSAREIEGRGRNINKASFEATVYPSPTSGFLQLDVNQQIDQIQILDVTGKLMKVVVTEQDASLIELNVNDLVDGHYFIRIQANTELKILRFVKQ